MSGTSSPKLEKEIYESWKRFKAGDSDALEEIYPVLMPFCLRVCSKTCGRYIEEGDEEASIARMSIIEAFNGYRPDKGYILLYMGRVIHNRIIDYKRSEKRKSTIFVEDLAHNSSLLQAEYNYIDDLLDEMARIQEIKQFRLVLNNFGIEFAELVTSSPRQAKTREASKQICQRIAADEELRTFLLEKGKLPIRLLEKKYKSDRKLLDRYRKYIIAGAIILINDFTYLKSYIWSGKGGNDHVQSQRDCT